MSHSCTGDEVFQWEFRILDRLFYYVKTAHLNHKQDFVKVSHVANCYTIRVRNVLAQEASAISGVEQLPEAAS